MALTPIRRLFLAAALALPLAACGSGREDPLVAGARGLVGLVGGGAQETAAPVFTAESVPPELLAALPGPLMLVEVPSAEASTGMTRVGRNGTVETWRDPNGIGLSVDASGVLHSTRGFGFDLMASDAGATSSALGAGRAGAVDRAMVHLDGEAQEIRRIYRCQIETVGRDTLSIAGREATLTRMTERCTGIDGFRFENVYWLDAQGRAVQSRQWVSPEIGTLRLTILRD